MANKIMSDNNFENNPLHSERERALASSASEGKQTWERDVLEKLAFAMLNEQRARRRWNIFFKFVMLGLIAIGIWMAWGIGAEDADVVGPHTALIEIDGTIE